jgi:hypothetical protein
MNILEKGYVPIKNLIPMTNFLSITSAVGVKIKSAILKTISDFLFSVSRKVFN